MLAQQTNVDVISNNIANMNTTAYTKRRAEFNDLLYQNIIRPGAVSTADQTVVPSGIQLGLGVRTAAVYRITEGGGLTKTDNSLDLAIRGRGYFQIELPEGKGTGYTRDGAFQRNGDGVPRLLSNRGEMLVRGKRAGILGRVCMDQLLLDVSDPFFDTLETGEEAVLFGFDHGNYLDSGEQMEKCSSISYELLCNVNRRVPRVYIQNGQIESIANILPEEV